MTNWPSKNPLRRCSRYSEKRYRGRSRLITVLLHPGDVLGFRLKGTRTEYQIPVEAAFDFAAKCRADQLRRERRKEK